MRAEENFSGLEPSQAPGGSAEYVTMFVSGQMFGIPVLEVSDVLNPQRIANIPLAPTEVAGSLNLRGRIVTAIDLRVKLGFDSSRDYSKSMSVVVEYKDELYSFVVDSVGEVLTVPLSSFEQNPANLERSWQEISCGVYRLEKNLLVILDLNKVLEQIVRKH